MKALINAGNGFYPGTEKYHLPQYPADLSWSNKAKPYKVEDLNEIDLKAAFLKFKVLPQNENLFSVLVQLG